MYTIKISEPVKKEIIEQAIINRGQPIKGFLYGTISDYGDEIDIKGIYYDRSKVNVNNKYLTDARRAQGVLGMKLVGRFESTHTHLRYKDVENDGLTIVYAPTYGELGAVVKEEDTTYKGRIYTKKKEKLNKKLMSYDCK